MIIIKIITEEEAIARILDNKPTFGVMLAYPYGRDERVMYMDLLDKDLYEAFSTRFPNAEKNYEGEVYYASRAESFAPTEKVDLDEGKYLFFDCPFQQFKTEAGFYDEFCYCDEDYQKANQEYRYRY